MVVATRPSRFSEFQVADEQVEVPTIRVMTFHEGGKPEVVFQWFGVDVLERRDLLGEQYFFPLPRKMADPEALEWMSHPEKFKVIFVGSVSEWPKPEARAAFGMSPNTLLFWVASAHYGTQQGDGVGPACFAIKLSLILADQESQLMLHPRTYSDTAVLDRLNEEFTAQQRR